MCSRTRSWEFASCSGLLESLCFGRILLETCVSWLLTPLKKPTTRWTALHSVIYCFIELNSEPKGQVQPQNHVSHFPRLNRVAFFKCCLCPRTSVDILGTSWDHCMSMVQYCFTSTKTMRLAKTDSPGRPPRLSHNSRIVCRVDDDDDELMLNVLRCHETY